MGYGGNAPRYPFYPLPFRTHSSMSATATTTDRNLPLLKQARELIAKGDLKNAAITLNTANRTVPGDARVFMLGSLMAEKAGNTAGAFESLRKAVSLAPEWGPGLLELALLLARNNQFAEAIQTAEKVHKLEPNNLVVLAGAIDVARMAGHLEMSVRLLRHGLARVPNDPQLTQLLATDLHAMKQHAEALEAWNQLVSAFPDNAAVRLGRLHTLLAMHSTAAAQEDAARLLALEPDNEVYRFFSEVAQGRTPKTQPPAISQGIFDDIAARFDQHLVRTLRYQLPKQVADKLLQMRPDRKFNVLDLGCGTGLLGACLGRLQGALVGVDVSLKMLEQAAQHKLYDKFHTVSVHDALDATPEALYEVIAALDVFIYAGDVTKAIPDAHRILVPGGTFVASFETATEAGPDLVLLSSGRYAHKRSDVERICLEAGFESISVEETVLRLENNEPIQGFVVWATKAQAKPAKAPRAPRSKAIKNPSGKPAG